MQIALRQELANSISHGFGFLFGMVSIPILIALSVKYGGPALIVGTSIYGFGFIMVYAFSTLYHSLAHPGVKNVLRTLDHISIYVMIAGSYTPLLLTYMYNPKGITLLAIVWSLALIGIVWKIFFTGRYEVVSTLAYIGMGWLMITVAKPFFAAMSTACMVMILVGAVLYCLGAVFYLWKRFTYHHVVWHLFVLAASICHYVAILLTIVR